MGREGWVHLLDEREVESCFVWAWGRLSFHVEIWDDQVWRTQLISGQKGWQFFTRIQYERDGRNIIRHGGIPVLTDEGEFRPNMFPREYVTFRYQ